MKILKSVIDIINNSISDQPPESGGILGSCGNELINEIVMDSQNPYVSKKCSYSPNIAFLNQNIELWQNKGISFNGIFHTHYFGVKTLSCGDKNYINEIMRTLPEGLNYLYFPIFVLPDRELICYKAIRINEAICIQEEPLIIEEM